MKKTLIIFGTRPEFIKMIPVFNEISLRRHSGFISVFTGQQKDLISDLFTKFNFKPDYTLHTAKYNNVLSFTFANILKQLQNLLEKINKKYDIEMIIGQGDTTTTACAAIISFFNGIPFTHIEAGLRTNNFSNPFPEEFFRNMISKIASIHCAPTESAKENLLCEGVSSKDIEVTGNTIVDSINMIRNISSFSEGNKNVVIITCHRRENLNSNFIVLMNEVMLIAKQHPYIQFKWISHTNPFVKSILRVNPFRDISNIEILPPINIIDLYQLYDKTRLIITDSGGMQEEAVSFNIPVIVFRNKTERTESVIAGYAHCCTFENGQLQMLFENMINSKPKKMHTLYGDGQAAKKIMNFLSKKTGRDFIAES